MKDSASYKDSAPYKGRWARGTLVKVAPLAVLEEFMATYHYHHALKPEQLQYAGITTTVRALGFYHGGDVLYSLADTGDWLWLEPCLEDANSEPFPKP
jgi:hypothetical protein